MLSNDMEPVYWIVDLFIVCERNVTQFFCGGAALYVLCLRFVVVVSGVWPEMPASVGEGD